MRKPLKATGNSKISSSKSIDLLKYHYYFLNKKVAPLFDNLQQISTFEAIHIETTALLPQATMHSFSL
jgi:hypothetical protein